MVRFGRTAIETESEHRTEKDEISGPKYGHEVHPKLAEAVLFVHGIPFLGQFPVLIQF